MMTLHRKLQYSTRVVYSGVIAPWHVDRFLSVWGRVENEDSE